MKYIYDFGVTGLLSIAGCTFAALSGGTAQAQTPPHATPPGMGQTVGGDPAQSAREPDLWSHDMTDIEVIHHIHAINEHEIELGRLAQANGSDDVRNFGKTLVSDHQKADKKLSELARKMGADMPTATPEDEACKATMAQLKTMSGSNFDRHFLITIQKGHDDAILFLTAQAFGHPTANDLKDFAKHQLGTLSDHRKKSIELLEKLSEKSPPTS